MNHDALPRGLRLLPALVLAASLVRCGSDAGGGAATAIGGSPGTTGGAAGVTMMPQSGGAVSAGGVTGAGGARATGGSQAGGSVGAGAAATGGGSNADAAPPGSGGTIGNGGVTGSGGVASSTGGAAQAGGAPSTATVVEERRSIAGHSTRLWELAVRSQALGKQSSVRLIVPARYLTADAERFPVLFLLHGGTDDYKSWSDKTKVETITQDLDLIVVMPDSGLAATYSDWFNAGAFGPPAWERYHVDELRLLLEQKYRANGSYAVAGLSSGGYGAMKYAARHPDIFRAAASFSGNLDRTSKDDQGAMQSDGLFTSLLEGSAQYAQWGDPAKEEVRWRTHNPVDLAPNLRGLPLSVATGDGKQGGCSPGSGTDPVESQVLTKNGTFAARLDALGIPYTKNFYTPGTHTWCFWERELTAALPMLTKALDGPRSLPSTFVYRSAEDGFAVWDYRFRVANRSGLAFTDVEVSENAVAATGNGLLHVTTAPRYTPGRTYAVGSAPSVADAVGRLDFEISLGDTAEQYTASSDPPGPRPRGPRKAVQIVAQ